MNLVTRFGCVPFAATAALLFGACNHQQQAAPPATPPMLGQTSLQAPTPVSDTTAAPSGTIVAISDEILQACNIPAADAYFAFDSSRLTAPDHGTLDAVATCFTTGPLSGRSLNLVGRADPRGTAEYNIALGQSRADAVTAYLTARSVDPANASATSRGAMDATGVDETGWAHDRRVDVLLGKMK